MTKEIRKTKLLKNQFDIVGTLVESNLTEKQSADSGKTYIYGTIVIKSVINGREQLTEVNLFSNASTQEGKESKLFAAYAGLNEKIGQRVSVSGELDENLFYSQNANQVTSYNRLRGRFVNDARSNQVDKAEFEFAGYVARPLAERLDKDGNLIHQEITLAEANYKGELPTYVKFAVTDSNIASIMSTMYEKGLTVKVNGEISIVTEIDRVEEETAFGTPSVKEYTRTYRNFIITSGSRPAEKGAYTEAEISELDAAYKDNVREIELKSKETQAFGGTTKAKAVDSNKSSLI